MKVNLNKYLSEEEIIRFDALFYSLHSKEKLSEKQKVWRFWSLTSSWIKTLEHKEEILKILIDNKQQRLVNAYDKILLPFLKNGIIIVPCIGNLLGIYREGKFIKHDDDLDLAIDYLQFQKIKDQISKRCKKYNWILDDSQWINKDFDLSRNKDFIAKLYSRKKIIVKIGKRKIVTQDFIDIWPIMQVSNKPSYLDMYKYQWNIKNVLNINGTSYGNYERLMERIENEGKLNKQFKYNPRYNTSINWIKSFLKKNMEQNSLKFMSIQKLGMYEDFYNVNPSDELFRYRNSEFLIPRVDDSFFERLYGDWKTPKESHTHLFDYRLIKDSYKLK